MLLPTTLSLAAAATVINLWLLMRCGQARANARIMYGDGGDETLLRRMRAHANFTENTPLVLILCALIEAAGKSGSWLQIVGGIYMLARIAHAIGMGGLVPARAFGMLVTLLTQLGLVIVAVLILLGKF